MEIGHKEFALDLKMSDEGAGEFTGYASTFGNLDRGNERVIKGAFSKSLDTFLKDGFVAVGHNWGVLPIATPMEAKEDDHGLFVRAAFHSTPDAQAARTVITERLQRGKSVKLSIGYEILDDERTDDGRLLKELNLLEYSVVTVPMNNAASVTSAKCLTLAEESDAVLAAVKGYIDRLTKLHDLRAQEHRALSAHHREHMQHTLEALGAVKQGLTDLLAASDPQKADPTDARELQALWRQSQELRRRVAQLGVITT